MVKRVTLHDMNKRTAIEVAVIAMLILMFTIAARLTDGAPFTELLPWN
jgi:hypothetical protein